MAICKRSKPEQRLPLLQWTFSFRVGEPELQKPEFQQDGISHQQIEVTRLSQQGQREFLYHSAERLFSRILRGTKRQLDQMIKI